MRWHGAAARGGGHPLGDGGVSREVEGLEADGGPCQELDADYRFEVPGPDKRARVCVQFKDYVTRVRVGAKAADECRYESRYLGDTSCRKCKKGH